MLFLKISQEVQRGTQIRWVQMLSWALSHYDGWDGPLQISGYTLGKLPKHGLLLHASSQLVHDSPKVLLTGALVLPQQQTPKLPQDPD